MMIKIYFKMSEVDSCKPLGTLSTNTVSFLPDNLLFKPSYGSLPPFHNIEYLGSAYDILKGNPESTQGHDSGFIGPTIFQFTYYQNLTTTDGRYSIPDHTTVHDAQSCSFAFSSTTIKDTRAYMDSLKVHVSTDFKGWGASFSGSSDYQSVHQSSVSENTVFISSHAQCESYGGSIDDAPFTKDFVKAVSLLPSSFNSSTREKYLSFIQTYGTHVATALIMGGRYGFRSEFTVEGLSDLSKTGINVKASAGYSGLIDISTSLATDDQQKDANTFNSYRKTFVVYQIGGKPDVSETGVPYSDWAQSVKDNPEPLSYRLTELYKYFTSKNFPNDHDIDSKKESLQNATLQYCMDISVDKHLCQKDFGPKGKSLITIVNTNSYMRLASSTITDAFQWYTFPNDPSLLVVGALLGTSNITNNFNFFIDNRDYDNYYEFVDFADKVMFAPKIGNYRPICDNGYLPVSDLSTDYDPYATWETPPVLRLAAKICIKAECFNQCQKVSTSDENIFLIGGGFHQLGNSGDLNIGSFYRDLTIDDNHYDETDLFKCLTYDCLGIQ